MILKVRFLKLKRNVACLSNALFFTNYFASHILTLDSSLERNKECQINLIYFVNKRMKRVTSALTYLFEVILQYLADIFLSECFIFS